MHGEEGTSTAASKQRAILTVALASACVPFFAAEFIPSTDLPQHLAQIRLLEALWGLGDASVDTSQMSARIFGANTLVYWPLFLLSRIVSLRIAGKLTLALIFALSAFGYDALARARGRDPLHALVAVPLLFSVSFYWGFLNFLSGLPLFLFYLVRLSRAQQERRAILGVAIDAALLLLMYWAHVFWIAVSAFALLALELRRDLRPLLRRSLAFMPVAALLLWWYPQLVEARRSAGFQLGMQYIIPLSERFSATWVVGTLLGGVQGLLEPITVLLLAAYASWSSLARWDRRSATFDRRLLALAGVLIAFALLAPDKHLSTILLNRRFLPIGAALLLLALPAIEARALRGVAAAAVALFSIFTSLAWALYDQVDLAGLRESLKRIPEGASVLGLDYRKTSIYIRDRPFLQTFAYAQVERGGELSFSFAEHASSIVSYDRPRALRWTPGLEWLPEQVTKEDGQAFDCMLVNAEPPQHEAFRARFGGMDEIGEGYFRAYCRR